MSSVRRSQVFSSSFEGSSSLVAEAVSTGGRVPYSPAASVLTGGPCREVSTGWVEGKLESRVSAPSLLGDVSAERGVRGSTV